MGNSVKEAEAFAEEARRHSLNRPQKSLVYDPERCRILPVPKNQTRGNVVVVDRMAGGLWAGV